jgi:hypothetical protein
MQLAKNTPRAAYFETKSHPYGDYRKTHEPFLVSPVQDALKRVPVSR